MAARSFKSVGKTVQDLVESDLEESPKPIGIKTPMRIGSNGEGILAMHYDPVAVIHDNFRNMLLTNKGERLGRFDFGANLRKIICEYYNLNDFEGTAMQSIQRTTSKYMPFISLDGFESDVIRMTGDDQRRLKMRITYDIPTLDVKGKQLELVFTLP